MIKHTFGLTQPLEHLLGGNQPFEHDLTNGYSRSSRFRFDFYHQHSLLDLVEPEAFSLFFDAEIEGLNVRTALPGDFVPQPPKFPNSARCPAVR